MNKNDMIQTGAEIASNYAVDALKDTIKIAATIADPVLGPIVSMVFSDVAERMLSKYESGRVSAVSQQIEFKIQQRLDAREHPRRNDDFYVKDEYEQSSASKLLEETLLKCKQEFEARKLEYYSNFWSNVCFDNTVSYEDANTIMSQFASLSFQQIKILLYLNSGKTISLDKWEKYMYSDGVLEPYYTLYSDALHLFNLRLAVACEEEGGALRVGTPRVRIGPSGKKMCRLLELGFRGNEEKEINEYIGHVDEIVDRLMNKAGDDGTGGLISTATDEDIDEIMNKIN